MKIQAISSNTTFKGLFTDKSQENNGRWRMEYRPYCWEKGNTSKMAPKTRLDIFASKLPDNEEIYIEDARNLHCKSSKDIFGTESYYVMSNGNMRKTISEMPAMNREESLTVLNDKLKTFLTLKNQKRRAMDNYYSSNFVDGINSSAAEFSRNYAKENSRFWGSNDFAMYKMQEHFNKVKDSAIDIYNYFRKYILLEQSADAVRNQRAENEKEIAQLAELRKKDLLIDISRRDVEKPNAPLVEALANLEASKNKFVCLPNGFVSVESLVKKYNLNKPTSEMVDGIVVNLLRRVVI